MTEDAGKKKKKKDAQLQEDRMERQSRHIPIPRKDKAEPSISEHL